MPVTYARTRTYTRIDLIKTQFRIALRRGARLSSDDIDRLMIGFDNHWIQTIHIYGLDYQNLCRAQSILEVNWNEYQTQMSFGRATVAIDERWTDGASIELDEAVNLFDRFVTNHSLHVIYHAIYTSQVNLNANLYAYVQQILGHVRANPLQWAGPRQGTIMSIPELPECTVGCYLT